MKNDIPMVKIAKLLSGVTVLPPKYQISAAVFFIFTDKYKWYYIVISGRTIKGYGTVVEQFVHTDEDGKNFFHKQM